MSMAGERPRTGEASGGGLLAFFIHHRNAANLIMAMMILFGVIALMRLNTQFFPTIDVPRVSVTVQWSGASAEDVERNILQVIEPTIRFLDDLEKMTSYAREGAASIALEFAENADLQKAQTDVETAIDAITTLPQAAEEPVVSRAVWYEQVGKLSLSGPFDETALRAFARQIRDDLLEAGIDKVEMSGFRDREYWIEIPEWQLRRLGLSIGDIAERIGMATRDMPSGTLEGAVEKQLRSTAVEDDPASLAAIEIVSGTGGEKVFLGDIARIVPAFDDTQTRAYRDALPAIELAVQRSIASDTLQSRTVFLDYVDSLEATLPAELNVTVYDIFADRLQDRIGLLVENALQGLIIVLITLFVFLNARIAFWVAVGIPAAVMAALGFMWLSGQSINMISLFALIMVLGIIVDDAIVVGEHTATRYAAGDPAALAAETGARRMFWPVFAAILTTQAAFLPLFFVSDVIGQIMSALPMVVIAALTASLIEAFLVLPGHLRHSLARKKTEPSRFRRWFDGGFERLRMGPFRLVAQAAFRWRYATLGLALASLILSIGAVMGGRVGFQFFPSPEGETLNAHIVMAAGTPREDVEAVLVEIDQALVTATDDLAPEGETLIDSRVAEIGIAGNIRGMNAAQISVQLNASEVRTVRTTDIVRAWRAAIPTIPGVEMLTIQERRGGPPGRDLDIRLSGGSPDTLKTAALELREVLAGYAGVSNIGDDLAYGKPEIIMALTPRGTALGFTLQSVGQQVRDAFDGAIARRFAEGEDEVTIRVLRDQPEDGFAALENLSLKSPQGIFVPLTEIVTLNERQGFSAIQRINGATTVSVSADLDTNVTTPAEMVAALQSGSVPAIARSHGLAYEFAGRDEERRKSFADLRFGAFVALGLIYLILAWLFASYSLPLAVMLIIPCGFVGALVGHLLLGFPLTILSLMGLLGLSGILVNDSIILVSRAVERRGWGEDLETAVVMASCDRFRAVLLTSLTTVGGLTPLLFERSLQAQFLMPMAVTLVFGLAFATLFVLFLVPAVLGIGHDLRRMLAAVWGAWFPNRMPAPAE